MNQRYLAGKRDSRRHSTTSFSEIVVVAGTSYQIVEVFFATGRGLKNNRTNFQVKNSTMKLSGLNIFRLENTRKKKKMKLNLVLAVVKSKVSSLLTKGMMTMTNKEKVDVHEETNSNSLSREIAGAPLNFC